MIVLLLGLASGFETAANDHLELKWMRDSEEFSALTTQVFLQAEQSVRTQARGRQRQPWTVVVDIDETLLDNTPYFLEMAAYDRPFDWPSWDAWCARGTAEPVPGAQAFVSAVRDAGGRVAFVSNRHERTRDVTVENLMAAGMWTAEDRMCLLTDDDSYTKRERRRQLRDGDGTCGWGEPVSVFAYAGDTMADLPEADEDGGRWEQLGVRTFVLPNPAYGKWEHGVTRPGLIVTDGVD